MLRQFTSIAVAGLLVLTACQKKEEAAKPAAAAATLPSDVQSVAATAVDSNSSATASSTETVAGSASTIEAPNGALQATGEFISPVTSELAAKIQGRVAKTFVSEGERVSAGQTLLLLDTDYSNLDLQRAQADLTRAEAAEADAKRDLDRKSELKAKGSVPQATWDRSQAMYDQARAARAAATANVGSAKQRLADSNLRAPFDGVIVEKRAEVGERLGDNSVAFVVAQTAPLKLRFDLPERYIARVKKGQSVGATVEPYPNQKFEGHVSVVGQVVDPKTRSFFVEAIFPNRNQQLRPGLFARVELEAK